jgi:flagellar basal-body rod protein FlgG
MIRALYSSASGMHAQQLNLDNTANNLSNVNTTGFKKSKIEFQDLIHQDSRNAGADVGGGNTLPTGIQIGHGVQLAATSKVFTTGEMTATRERWDVAINGDGFLEIQLPNGTSAFTRDGALKVDQNGQVTTSQGHLVLGGFQPIPANATNVSIGDNGTVTVSTTDGNEVFNINLVRFQNPSGLRNIGGNLFVESPASGVPEPGEPGQDGFGRLLQGYLEMSNVKVVDEMVNLIVAQRAYEVNAKSIQAADEMMSLANNVKR